MNAKLQTVRATQSNKGPRGAIWSTGLHHVYVDDKPARVFVPQSTIYDTFEQLRGTLDEDVLRFGVDHLPVDLFRENQILKKMNLHDVGEIGKVAFDGDSIHILESELTNPTIRDLYERGELPAYSIVGKMEASPCPSERADYVVDRLIVERVDFVEEGGCQVCTTTAEPGEIILTSKKSKNKEIEVEADKVPSDIVVEDEEVVEVTEEAQEPEEEEDVAEAPTETPPEPEEEGEDVAEETPEAEAEAGEDVEVDNPVDEDPTPTEGESEMMGIIRELQKEIKELREMGGKKPLTAKYSEEHDETIEKLIKAGKATPAQREPLRVMAEQSPEAFTEYAANLSQVVDMSTKAKLAPTEKKSERKEGEWEVDDILAYMKQR